MDDLPLMGLQQSAPGSIWMRPVEMIAAALLTFIIGILLVGVTARYVFSSPIIWGDETASLAFLWLAMLGGAIAIHRHEHLRLTVFLHLLGEQKQKFVTTVGLLLTAVFLGSLLYPAIDYAIEESYVTSASLLIPMSWRRSALPVGLGLMLAIVILHGVKIGNARVLLGAAVLVGAVGGGQFALEPALAALGNWNIVVFLVFGVSILRSLRKSGSRSMACSTRRSSRPVSAGSNILNLSVLRCRSTLPRPYFAAFRFMQYRWPSGYGRKTG